MVNLLLMSGAGMLLLSDPTLEMRKDLCFGVVGQYGACKTTLIKEIVSGNIVPKHFKCVHVDDSELGEMSTSCLSAVEYLLKMALNISVTHTSRDTLLSESVREAADLHGGTPMGRSISCQSQVVPQFRQKPGGAVPIWKVVVLGSIAGGLTKSRASGRELRIIFFGEGGGSFRCGVFACSRWSHIGG